MLAVSNVLITREKNQKEEALSKVKASETVAKSQEQLVRARYREVQESLARQTSETARQAFEKDQIGPGLLWTIESWRAAIEAEHPALQHAARANLSAWLPYLPHLKAVVSHTHPVENAAFSADGKIILTASEDARRGSGTPPPAGSSALPCSTPNRCSAWRSAPTARLSSPVVRTARHGSGIPRPAGNSGRPWSTRARSCAWHSAPTARPFSRPAWMVMVISGTSRRGSCESQLFHSNPSRRRHGT